MEKLKTYPKSTIRLVMQDMAERLLGEMKGRSPPPARWPRVLRISSVWNKTQQRILGAIARAERF